MNVSIEKKRLAALFAIATLCATSHAGEWYVDAVNGSDANAGLDPASAWKTLTHAVTTIPAAPPGGQQLIHVAPGFYNAANREGFPLEMRPGFRLRGDQGSALTILEAPGQPVLSFRSTNQSPASFDALSGAEGLTLRNSGSGIDVDCESSADEISPSFDDIVIDGIGFYGVYAVAIPPFGVGSPVCHPTFAHLSVSACATAIYIDADGNEVGAASVTVALTDSVVTASFHDAISVEAEDASARLTLERCRVTANGGNGVVASAGSSGDVTVIAHGSLFAANGGSGLHALGAFDSSVHVALTDVTAADNGNCGVRALFNAGTTHSIALDNSIFSGNSVADVVAGPVLTASHCDSGDGALAGQPGCIAADPMFVNTASADFRLRFGSPCIETGDPASSGALDLLGHARPFDGDLDTIAKVDMGAFEFEPLHLVRTPRLGEQFGFELWGATGAGSTLFLAREPLMPATSTPFGDRYLDPSALSIATVPVQPGPPFVVRRALANDPLLIGTTFSFQALTDSALAPQGQAYTNPTSFVVMP